MNKKAVLNLKTAAHQKAAVFLFVLFCASVIIYLPCLSGDFIWDDKALIVNNPHIQNPGIFLKSFISELHPGTQTNYYRPLTAISFALNFCFFKLNPFWYHLTNIFIHFFVGSLLFYIIKKLTNRIFLSFLVAIVFLVHPIHGEAVGYISGRADLLAAMFCLLSGLYYFDRRRLGISLFLLLCALLSKETAIVLPFVILGFDFIFCDPVGRLKRVSPFFILILFYGLLRSSVLNFSNEASWLTKKGFSFFDIGFFQRIYAFFKTLVIYIGGLIIPVGFHMERVFEFEYIHFFHWVGFFVFVFLCFLLRREKKILFFSFSWFLIWLLPQSSLVFPKIMADHFMYMPSIGFFVIIAVNIDRLKNISIRRLVSLALVLYFSLFSFFYNWQWRDEKTFFARLTNLSSGSIKAHEALAELYLSEGDVLKALLEYERILALASSKASREPKIIARALYNIGVLYMGQGKDSDAEAAFAASLKIDPAFSPVYNNLGILYERLGKMQEAEVYYRKSISLFPNSLESAPVYNNLGVLYAKKGEVNEAVDFWLKALEVDGSYEPARKNLVLLQKQP